MCVYFLHCSINTNLPAHTSPVTCEELICWEYLSIIMVLSLHPAASPLLMIFTVSGSCYRCYHSQVLSSLFFLTYLNSIACFPPRLCILDVSCSIYLCMFICLFSCLSVCVAYLFALLFVLVCILSACLSISMSVCVLFFSLSAFLFLFCCLGV